MKLKKRLDERVIFTVFAILVFAVYLVVGLHPAEASDYEVNSHLEIPGIGLEADVTRLAKNGSGLDTPEQIVGSYSEKENKTLLIGHSTTVFDSLDEVKLGQTIIYGDKNYRVAGIRVVKKDLISMKEILSSEEKDTIVLMTCAGTLLDGGDATHRLIITASAV